MDECPSDLGSDLIAGAGRVPEVAGSSDGVGEVYGGGDERDWVSLNCQFYEPTDTFRGLEGDVGPKPHSLTY